MGPVHSKCSANIGDDEDGDAELDLGHLAKESNSKLASLLNFYV